MSLRALGWNPKFAEAFASLTQDGLLAARVAVQHRGGYEVWTADQILAADVTGRFRHHVREAGDYPAVGDWVAIEPVAGAERAAIHAVLPRRTKLARAAPGNATEEQVLVANIDEIFILEPLGTPPNVRRIGRFLTMAADSGASPIVILTKADLCHDLEETKSTVSAACPGIDVLAICALTGAGLAGVKGRLRAGRTVVLVGRSGAGKSTLINQLSGEDTQHVLPVREVDQKGRHATTSREMVFLSGGGVLIDTPGLRELQLWEGGEGLETTFADVEALANACRFSDCRHETEPGCSVLQAVQDGTLPEARLAAFNKLRAEVAQFASRRERRARADESRRARQGRRRGE